LKKAHKPKIPRPKSKELRKLYKHLITTSVALRIETLKTVLQWYDQALPYVESKVAVDVDRARIKDKMLKARRLGISSTWEGEQETSFRTAIQLVEKYCKVLRPWPVEKVYAKYDLASKRLEIKQTRLEGKFGAFLSILRALKPETYLGEPLRIVISDSSSGKKFGHRTNEFLYSRDSAKQAHAILRQRGVLPLVVEELSALSRAAGQEKNAEGHFILNPVKQNEAMVKMLRNFVAYCSNGNAPKRLVRTAYNSAESVPKPHSTGPADKQRIRSERNSNTAFRRGPKLDGLFVEGSALGVVYSTLKDGLWHEKSALQKLVSVNIQTRLRVIQERQAAGNYKVEFDGEKVRMVREV